MNIINTSALARVLKCGVSAIAIAVTIAAMPAAGSARASEVITAKPSGATVAFLGKVNLRQLASGKTGSGGVQPFAVNRAARQTDILRSIPVMMPKSFDKANVAGAEGFNALLDTPSSDIVTGLSFTGFTGITHAEQRLADNGNQFSLEPPDQALAVGGKYVLEAVNNAIAVYDVDGNPLVAPVAMNIFFGQFDEINRTTGQRGPSLSDPRAYYDAATKRFFVVEWATLNSPSGAPLNVSVQFLAVSVTSDPTGSYYLYSYDTTNVGVSGCPCFPDYQQIGIDQNGLYVSANLFGITSGRFGGTTIYALDKAALENGSSPGPLVQARLPNDFTVHPTVTPPGGIFATVENGTEYFAEALADISNTGVAHAVRVFALSNTGSLATGSPLLKLSSVNVKTETYAEPPPAVQPDGPRPYGATLVKPGKPLPPVPELDSGSARIGSTPVYVNGTIWAAVTTGLPATTTPAKAAIAYFAITPTGGASTLSASLAAEGILAAPQETSVIYPAIAMPVSGNGGIGFTLVGPGNYPSAAIAPLSLAGAGPIQITGLGALPDDGFTGYNTNTKTQGVGRWGDYGAAAVGSNGTLWFGSEYIPDTSVFPRTLFANWGTFITAYKP